MVNRVESFLQITKDTTSNCFII